MARTVRCCALRCDIHGDLHAQIVEVDENDPNLRGYDSLTTVERCADAFERGLQIGLLQLAFGELSSRLPAALSYCREWMKSMVTFWLLSLRANPRARLDPPPGLLEAWVRAAHRIPELGRLRVDCLRRLWRSHQEGAKAKAATLGKSLAEHLADGTHPLWKHIGDVVLRIEQGSGHAALPFVLHCVYVEGLSTTAHVRTAPIYGPIFGDNRVPGLGDYLRGILERVAERSQVLRRLLDSQEIFSPCGLIPLDTHRLLLDAPLLEAMGIDFRVPEWWKQRKPPKFSKRTRIGSSSPSRGSLAGLLDIHTSYVVDGDELSESEWRKIVEDHINGLVLVRDRWIEIDSARIQDAIQSWQASESLRARGQIPFAEALGLLDAGPSAKNNVESEVDDAPTEQISAGPWLAAALAAVQRRLVPADVDPGPEFHGVLRPYQREGVAWLSMLMELRVGALLADDMGLGKTVQIIALMLGLRRRGETGPYLLVVPASLIGNWRAELMKFAQSVPFTVVHHEFGGETEAMSADLVITSYATILRRPALRQRAWGLLVLDEAQTIKSSGAKVTAALKSITSHLRIALTGTPVENHVDDLWSIMDFLNPGLLGARTAFRERWRSSIANPNGGGMDEIRALIRPYMLRRRKTDPGVAPDLPDKVEETVECGLTAMQASLYSQVLYSARARVAAATEIERGKEVLAIIRQLKEICGHPALHLPKCDFDPGRSAKFLRLLQICKTIAANHEKVLVFTQFSRLVAPLANALREVFGRPGLIFEGDTMVSQRPRIVSEFQDENGPSFMILTLKAGGTGLNLTAASHVIHFDLWWNPAAEAQATDRTHRIGQTRTVFVHRLVCRGTLEEAIDKILQRKRAIAEDLLAPEAESLQITSMSDDELMRMINLDEQRARDDEDEQNGA